MVKIKEVDIQGKHIGCDKLICNDFCWREATRKELNKMWGDMIK